MATRDEILRFIIEASGTDDVDALGKALESLEQDAKGGGEAAQALAKQLEALADAAESAAEFHKLEAETKKLEERFQEASEHAYHLKQELQALGEPAAAAEREFNKAKRAADSLGAALGKQEARLDGMATALAAAGINTRNLVGEQDRLEREAAGVAAAMVHQQKVTAANAEAAERNARATKAMGDAFRNASSQISSIGARLTAAGAAAAAAATAFAAYKTGEFFTESIKGAAEFEAQISEIGAVTGSTGAELEKLKETARQAALDTGESFASVSTTLGELARAVGDAEVSARVLGPTLDLAAAGGLEAAAAAEILTTTLTQFGFEADQATRVADLLANGANVTTASVTQLGNSLSYAAPLARQLGMSVEDTVAAIGALADEGFRGERAGTALRNVMGQMLDPTSKFSEELDKLGIQTRNFNEVMFALSKAGAAGQKALLSLDSVARPAIMALVNSGAAGITRLTESFELMEVTAASAAAQMRDNMNTAAKQAGRAFEDLRNQLVEPLLDPLTREFQDLAATMREFAQSESFAQIQTALATMFDAGIEGAKEFVDSVDWTALAQRITDFANGATESLKNFSESSAEYIGYLREILNGFGIVIDSVQTGIFGIAAAAAKLAQVGAEVSILYLELQKLNPAARLAAKAIGVDLAGAVEHLTEVSGGMGAVYDEFAQRTSKNFGELRDGLDRIGEGIEKAGAGAPAAGQEIADGLEPAAVKIRMVGEDLQFLPEAAAQAAAGMQSGGEAMAKSLTPVQAAAEQVEKAFATLRIKSQEELDAAAKQSAAAFEAISRAARDGTGSIADARAAFESYARAQLAAAANMDASARQQVEAMLRIKGGAIGATDALQRLGLVGAEAPGRIQPPAERAATSLHGLADAADRAGESVTGLGESADGAGEALDRMTASAESYTISLGKVSEATAQQFRDMAKSRHAYTSYSRHGTTAMGLLIKEVKNERDALKEANKALDEHIQKYDPLTERLVRLRREYQHMTDEDLLALARKQEQLEKLEQQSRAQQGVTTAAQGTNYAYAEGSRLLDEQLKKQAELDQERERNTRRTEITVNFVAKSAKIEFDPSALTDAHWRLIASKVIEMVRRDMP